MRGWFTAVALCVLLCGAGVLVARSVGAGVPMPIELLFEDEAGQPCSTLCLLGVRPGFTPFGEAVRRVRGHPLARDAVTERRTGDFYELLGPHWVISLVRNPSGSTASISVRLEPDPLFPSPPNSRPSTPILEGKVPLGAAILKFGPPPSVQLSQRSARYVRHFYPNIGVLLTSYIHRTDEGRHVDVHDPLRYVSLNTLEWFRDVWQMPMFASSSWSGFGTAKRYLRAAR